MARPVSKRHTRKAHTHKGKRSRVLKKTSGRSRKGARKLGRAKRGGMPARYFGMVGAKNLSTVPMPSSSCSMRPNTARSGLGPVPKV